LRIEVRSKVERGYNLLEGTVEPRAAHPPRVDLKAEMTVEEALQRIVRECLAVIFRNQLAALAGVPDGVHQMHVVVRRFRSALTAVKRMLPADQYEWVRRELKWLAGILGPARNWDMLSSSIIAPIGTELISPQDLEGLYRASEQERRLAHEQAKAAIQSARYTTAALKLSRWFASRGRRDQRVSEQSALLMAPIGAVSPALISRRTRKPRKPATALRHSP
jgi:inorganic triphosphatase YgiF